MVLAGLFLIPTLLVGKRGSSNKGLPWMLRIGAINAISLCARCQAADQTDSSPLHRLTL